MMNKFNKNEGNEFGKITTLNKNILKKLGFNLDHDDKEKIFEKCLDIIKRIFSKKQLNDDDFIHLNALAELLSIYFSQISASKFRDIYDSILKIKSKRDLFELTGKIVYLEAKETKRETKKSLEYLRRLLERLCECLDEVPEEDVNEFLVTLKEFFEMIVAYHKKHAKSQN